MQTPIRNTDFTIGQKTNGFINPYQQLEQYNLEGQETRPATATGRRSFLVFKENKYLAVPVENIAFFHIRYACSNLVCMDRKEYPVNHSLDQIQNFLTGKQFFRVNRQYLINFNAIKEVEHYFARKLLVNLIIGTTDKLLVPKDKARIFLHWLENG